MRQMDGICPSEPVADEGSDAGSRDGRRMAGSGEFGKDRSVATRVVKLSTVFVFIVGVRNRSRDARSSKRAGNRRRAAEADAIRARLVRNSLRLSSNAAIGADRELPVEANRDVAGADWANRCSSKWKLIVIGNSSECAWTVCRTIGPNGQCTVCRTSAEPVPGSRPIRFRR